MQAFISKLFALPLLAGAFSLAVLGQSNPAPEAKQAPKAPAAEKKLVRPLGTPRIPGSDEKVIFYSGFLIDLRTAEKPSKVFSLRRPVDPLHDADNLIVRPGGKPVAFKLFSIDF